MDELAKSFAELAQKYGPSVTDAALGAARTEAYSYLISSLIWFAVAVALLSGSRFLRRQISISRLDSEDKMVLQVIHIVMVVLGFGSILVGIWMIIDPWTWAAINHPEMWLAKQAFHI